MPSFNFSVSPKFVTASYVISSLSMLQACTGNIHDYITRPYFIKVKIILSLRFKINLIFYLIKEFMKNSCVNFFYEIVNKISIKVKRNSKFKEFAKT